MTSGHSKVWFFLTTLSLELLNIDHIFLFLPIFSDFKIIYKALEIICRRDFGVYCLSLKNVDVWYSGGESAVISVQFIKLSAVAF
jgi:hypothetical protein